MMKLDGDALEFHFLCGASAEVRRVEVIRHGLGMHSEEALHVIESLLGTVQRSHSSHRLALCCGSDADWLR